MRISIVSQGDARRTVPDTTFEGTFEEFSENFETYQPNKRKHDGYFVRGELDGKRSNANLPSAQILMLDGDQSVDNKNSAPCPKLLHEILKKEGIKHFIYTTHSYAPPKKMKWRAVIECEMTSIKQLKPTLEAMFELLADSNYPLVNVKENWTWSQPWFMPNRQEDDGHYIFLKYMEGDDYLPIEVEKVQINLPPPSMSKSRQPTTERTHLDNMSAIREGISYYKELQDVMYGMARDGRAQLTIEADLEMIMLGSKAAQPDHPDHEKWQKRLEKLPTYVQQAIDCDKDDNDLVDLSDLDYKEQKIESLSVPFPPGLAGELCKDFFDMSPHPNEEICLVGAIGLVAGICGRKYNVLNTGLNIYATLLADSGLGKSVIKDGINRAIRSSSVLNAGTFVGAVRFTGPKAIFEMLNNGMSRICVIEEAGLVNESQAGDNSGVNRAMLDLYTSSGSGQYAGGENYSDSKNSIPVLASPSLSVVNVSTPKSYLSAMKNKSAELSGEIARMWLTRTLRDKAKLNVNRKKDFSKNVRNRVNELITFCVDKQDPSTPDKVVDLGTDGIDLEAEANAWVKRENQYKADGDSLRKTVATRAFIKTIKLASIVSVFNGYNSVDRAAFDWAKEAVETELKLIEQTFTFEATDDLGMVAISVLSPAIIKMVQGVYKDKKCAPSKELQKRGMFTRSNVSQAIKGNKTIKELDDDPTRNNPKTGLDKSMDYMIREGLIRIIRGDELTKLKMRIRIRATVIYQVTDEFHTLMQTVDGQKI